MKIGSANSKRTSEREFPSVARVPCAPDAVSTERIERALRTCAQIVIQPGGEVYTCIFERLESELAARQRQHDTRSRARQLLGGK